MNWKPNKKTIRTTLFIMAISIICTLLTLTIYEGKFFTLLKDINNNYTNILIFIVTLVYTVFNTLMFNEMKKTRERQEQPEIIVLFKRYDYNLFHIILKNISTSPAYKIQFVNMPDIYAESSSESINVKEKYDILCNVIEYMSPYQTYEAILPINSSTDDTSKSNLLFDLQYYDNNDKRYTLKINIGLNTLKCLPNESNDIAKAIDDLNFKIDQISMFRK